MKFFHFQFGILIASYESITLLSAPTNQWPTNLILTEIRRQMCVRDLTNVQRIETNYHRASHVLTSLMKRSELKWDVQNFDPAITKVFDKKTNMLWNHISDPIHLCIGRCVDGICRHCDVYSHMYNLLYLLNAGTYM